MEKLTKHKMAEEGNALEKDRISSVGERWNKVYGNYFSNTLPLQVFWDVIKDKIPMKEGASVLELGSANGNLLKFVRGKLVERGVAPKLFAVDYQASSLESLNDDTIERAVGDLVSWKSDKTFDLVFMRSVLHYNTFENQVEILKHARELLADDSVFINQLAINNTKDGIDFARMCLEVFSRKIYIFTEERYLETTSQIFTENEKIGDCIPMTVTAEDLLNRFSVPENRAESWEKLRAFTGWESESEETQVWYPIFKHKA